MFLSYGIIGKSLVQGNKAQDAVPNMNKIWGPPIGALNVDPRHTQP